MKSPSIQITVSDLQRLHDMLKRALRQAEITPGEAAVLQSELDRAEIVGAGAPATDVVTMHSTVDLLDLDSGEEETYTLVFPEEADPAEGKVSVLAPVGTAMLGYRTGDVFQWPVPSGTRRLEIKQIRAIPAPPNS